MSGENVGVVYGGSGEFASDAIRYRPDDDLDFLQHCHQDDLDILIDILIKKGEQKEGARVSQELSFCERYKTHYPNHSMYWDLIAAELQLYGGNTIANTFRGTGVLYKEILLDVCKNLKVNFNKDRSTRIIEKHLLDKLIADTVENMNAEQLKEFAKEFNLSVSDVTNITKDAVLLALQTAIKLNGFLFYRLITQMANEVVKFLLKRGLSFGANQALTKGLSVFAGPIGLAITGIWTLYDISSPAYRVTRPAVIFVAYMRWKMDNQKMTQPT